MSQQQANKRPAYVAAAEHAVFQSLERSLRVHEPRAKRNARLIRDLRLDGDDLSDLFLGDLEKGLAISLSQQEVDCMHTVQDAIDVCVRALENRFGLEDH